MNNFLAKSIKEVEDCHILIEEWFHGTEQATPQLLEQLLKMFSPSFSMINPKGVQLNSVNLREFLSKMRGARPDVKIKVTPPQIILAEEDFCILKYEEIQSMSSETLHRISTAVFVSDGNGGVLWQHLHETWVGDE